MIKKTAIWRISSLFILTLFLVYCSSNDSNQDIEATEATDSARLLTNIYQNGILSDFSDMLNLVNEHQTTLQQFKENTNSQNLATAIEEDKELNILWDSIEVYRLQLLRLVYSDVQHFPVETTSLLDRINSENSINEAFFINLPDRFKGLLTNSYLLNSFSAEVFTNEPKYVDFLLANLAQIEDRIVTIQDFWIEEGDAFVSASGSGIDQSINRLFNVYINLLETIMLVKLEVPLTNQNQDFTESPHNDISILLIEANLKALQKSFNGNFQNSADNYGFDDYLISLNRGDLADFINTKIDEALAISSNLNSLNTIVNEASGEADVFRQAIRDLYVLLKVDVSSALDITVTFTDNDGD